MARRTKACEIVAQFRALNSNQKAIAYRRIHEIWCETKHWRKRAAAVLNEINQSVNRGGTATAPEGEQHA